MIFRRVRKGITYIYERVSTEGKRHEKVIGKVDENGNEIYYADSRYNHASRGKGRRHGKNTKSEQNVVDENAITRCASDFLAPVDKVTKSVFDSRKNPVFYDRPEILIEVGRKGGKPVRNIVSINIDELKNVILYNDVMLNPYNRALHNIAVSLYAAGNTHFTPRMIYETMNGNSRLHKPPEQVYKAIMEGMRNGK